jgi:hypothetical protein
MLKRACVFVLLLTAGACGGGKNTITSPSSTASPSDPTITFGGLAANANGSPVTTYTESGFTVSATSGNWMVDTYGKPGPSIIFKGATGTIQVTAGGAPFGVTAVDLYSSTTPIPYTITGQRQSTTTFTMAATLPNTFGAFVTVVNPQAADLIDTLTISLTNPLPGNPVGVDNIVVCLPTAGACASPTPAPTPTFSLSGVVTDNKTRIGISGATVSVANGPNAGKSTTTDSLGDYSFTGLQQLPLVTVNASASNYVSQSNVVPLTSNQTLSFHLIPQPPPGAITFNGLAPEVPPEQACPCPPLPAVSTYTESGFTVSATAGRWTVDGYGNPGPSIIFTAPGGSTVTGTIQVTAGGAAFAFTSVDLYSSTTPIPYTIAGRRNSTTAFTMAATLPNTFGNFVTVVNPAAAVMIDTLVISLSNPSAPCCSNPMGVDNIVVSK